jgi:hypothetical protein
MKNQLTATLCYAFALAFILTQVLFFIDEGFYDFRWMKSYGNWIVFALYVVVLTLFFTLIGSVATVVGNKLKYIIRK